jgi:hypothetical protein
MKSVALRRRFVYGTSGEGHGTTVLVTKVCVPIVWSCTVCWPISRKPAAAWMEQKSALAAKLHFR